MQGGKEYKHAHAFTKISSKWFINLSVKGKNTKQVEDNIGENLGALDMVIPFWYSFPFFR